jgi:cyclic pyranopterin phosphate synthase
MRRRELPTAAVLRELARGRDDGFDAVSFTGGEPTIRRDLVGLVRAARARGFEDVKVQTNGLLLAHEPNVDRLIEAGVTRFHVSIHTHVAEKYDALVRREGAFPLMEAGLANLARRGGVDLTADVIMKTDTLPRLGDAVAWLDAHGVRQIDLWFVSLTDGNAGNVASLPRMTDAAAAMNDVFAAFPSSRIRSLHVPRCLLGAGVSHAWDPGAEGVRVVSPDAVFDLKDSKLAGSVHVPACEGCAHRPICPGVRRDYLDVYGDGEIVEARQARST